MVMVGSEVVLALVTLPENDSQQSVVYLSSENRVEIRDETLAEASPQDVLPVLPEKTERTTPNSSQLSLLDKSSEPLAVDRIPVKRLKFDKNLDLFDGSRKIGGLINDEQRQQWLQLVPCRLSYIVKSERPEDEVIVLHNGDALVYRLLLPARESQGSAGTASKRSKKSSPPKKSPGAGKSPGPDKKTIASPPASRAGAASGVPVELFSAAHSWISALSKEACEKAIASQMDIVIQNLTGVFEKILNEAFVSHMRHENDLRQELDRKNQEINGLKILAKDLEHTLKITHDIAVSEVSGNLERASLILRGYSEPAQDGMMPGEKLQRLLESSEHCLSPHCPDDLIQDEGISNFMDEANRMYTDLRELAEIFVEQKMMTARKGENDERSDLRD
jgi:hypothetical protein